MHDRSRPPSPLVALLVALLPACGVGTPPLEPVELASREGIQARVAELVDEHVALVRANPTDAQAHGTLGLVYEANELWGEAAASFANAAVLDPEEPWWRFHRAVALQQRGADDEAFRLLVEIETELPEEAAVLQRLGDACLERRELERARGLFERATAAAPRRAEGHFGLGAVLWELDEVDAAREALEEAVLLDPTLHAAHYLLGTVYRELGRTEDAEEELALGLNRTPTGDPRLRGSRALPGPFARDVRRFAMTRMARMTRAIDLLGRGKTPAARKILTELREEFPDDIAVLNNLAFAELHSGEPRAAMELWDRALELDPDSVDTHLALAGALVDQGFTSRAVQHVERALELAPDHGEVHYVRGRVLKDQGRSEAAVEALERSVALDPRRTDAWLLLADLLYELERYQEAASHYRRATRTKPDEVRAHLGQARAAVRLGRRAAALKAFNAAKRFGPDDPAVRDFAREFAE